MKKRSESILKRLKLWEIIVAPVIAAIIAGIVLSYLHTNNEKLENDNKNKNNTISFKVTGPSDSLIIQQTSDNGGNNIVIKDNSGPVTIIVPESKTAPLNKHVECGLPYSDAVKFAKQAFNEQTSTNGDVSITAALYNHTKGDKEYSPIVLADKGDAVVYRVKIANNSDKLLKTNAVRIALPPSLKYRYDSSRVLYKVAEEDKYFGLNDSIISHGANMIEIPPHHYVYVIYKVYVAEDAVCGIYGTATQMYNKENNINLTTDNGLIFVK